MIHFAIKNLKLVTVNEHFAVLITCQDQFLCSFGIKTKISIFRKKFELYSLKFFACIISVNFYNFEAG